ncbi:MAG: hypothetical protein ABIE25_06580 [Thermoplasmatota archaeon]
MISSLEKGKIVERVWKQMELYTALGLDFWRVLENEVAILSVGDYRGLFRIQNLTHKTDYMAHVFQVDFHRVDKTNYPDCPRHGAWEIAEYRWRESFGDASPYDLRGTYELSAGKDYRILGHRQVDGQSV